MEQKAMGGWRRSNHLPPTCTLRCNSSKKFSTTGTSTGILTVHCDHRNGFTISSWPGKERPGRSSV